MSVIHPEELLSIYGRRLVPRRRYASTEALWRSIGSEPERAGSGRGSGMDTKVISRLHPMAGIFGLKTTRRSSIPDRKPFKRSLQPYGGIRMAEKACRTTAMRSIRRSSNSSQASERPTMQASSMHLLRKCGPADQPYHYRLAGCIWKRPDHRRLSALALYGVAG